MKILVTGAAGFTGRFFMDAAFAAGHEVVPLSADLRDADALAVEVAHVRPEAVVHLAAISFVAHADAAAFYAVNVVGTTRLLSVLAGLQTRPRAVLVASSANIYGNCPHSPIAEGQSPAPVNHYAASKLAMEHLVHTYANRLPIMTVRPFNYTGHGQAPQFLIPKLVSHFARRAERIELGNLDVEREFNDVRMVCEVYLRLLQKGHPGETYNVCSGQPYSLGQVIRTLEGLTGHRMEIAVNPAFVRANEVHRLCGDPSKLIHAVGPLPATALEDTLRWMLEAADA